MSTWRMYLFSLMAVCYIGGCIAFPIGTEETATPPPVLFNFANEKHLGRYTGPWWVWHKCPPTAEARSTHSPVVTQSQHLSTVPYCNLLVLSCIQGGQHAYQLRTRARSNRIQLPNARWTASCLLGRADGCEEASSNWQALWHVSDFI